MRFRAETDLRHFRDGTDNAEIIELFVVSLDQSDHHALVGHLETPHGDLAPPDSGPSNIVQLLSVCLSCVENNPRFTDTRLGPSEFPPKPTFAISVTVTVMP